MGIPVPTIPSSNILFRMNLTHVFSAFATLAAASALESCEWLASSSGIQQTCLPGWYGKGLCGSGRRGACTTGLSPLSPRHDFQFQCCTQNNHNDVQSGCKTLSGGTSGFQRTCPEGMTMFGACSSNTRNECSGQDFTDDNFSIQCCENQATMTVDYS